MTDLIDVKMAHLDGSGREGVITDLRGATGQYVDEGGLSDVGCADQRECGDQQVDRGHGTERARHLLEALEDQFPGSCERFAHRLDTSCLQGLCLFERSRAGRLCCKLLRNLNPQ